MTNGTNEVSIGTQEVSIGTQEVVIKPRRINADDDKRADAATKVREDAKKAEENLNRKKP